MADNNAPKAGIGIVIGGILVLSAAFFILSGGALGGKKTVQGDRDLPPGASVTSANELRRDRVPFGLERTLRDGLSRRAVPVVGVRRNALDPVQVGMRP